MMRTSLKNIVALMAILVLMPVAWISLTDVTTDVRTENILENRLSELRDRLHQAESLNRERETDIQTLRSQMKVLVDAHVKINASSVGVGLDIGEKTRQLLANLSVGSVDLHPPSMFHYLPHLIGKSEGLRPHLKISRGRMGVSMVIGVPTIKRPRESYLMTTLKSLVESMKEQEKKECLIVVFVAEPYDQDFCRKVADDVEDNFPLEVESGLIEVITAPKVFYPDLNKVKESFGDTKERVKWRTKQNLDYSFLMMYAKSRGTYYVQLEDDVIAKVGFLTIMKNFALNQKSDDWMLLEFSHLGFIGKLFKSSDLPFVVEFLLMYYKDKPIDWLLDHLLTNKVCNPEKDGKHCQRSVAEVRRRFKPSLFQHIGTHSSLSGKVQKLKDRDFGKGGNVRKNMHMNPAAEVSTTFKIYQRHSLEKAYLGETFFWGLIPRPGDVIMFKFNQPILIEKYYFQSGNSEHPGDKLFNTTVEVKPSSMETKQEGILDNAAHKAISQLNKTEDGFLILSTFNHDNGVAKGNVDASLGPVSIMRLRVLTESTAWVLLNEISITVVKPKKDVTPVSSAKTTPVAAR